MMATVDSSDMDVVVELGVPLASSLSVAPAVRTWLTYGASPGVPGSDGGGGRLISVGALVVILMAGGGGWVRSARDKG